MWQKLETTGHRLTAGRDGTKLNGKRRIVATSGGSDTTWKAGRDYVKHFLPFPCPCFSTSFFFRPFSTLFAVWSHPASATNICVVHRRNALLSISPPTFPCFSLHHSCLMYYCCLFLYRAKLSFFSCLYSQLNGTCFSFGGVGFFFTLFCEPVMSFDCSVCCVERGKKWIKLGVLLSFFF